MKYAAAAIFICFIGLSGAVVFVPPVVYFLTLSMGAFLANAVVSLLIFGAFKGLLGKKVLGRSVFEIFSSGILAIGTAAIALICMTIAAFLVQPVDLASAAICAVFAGTLFFAFKAVLSFKEFVVSRGSRRQVVFSWLALAAFVAIAAGVSCAFAIEVRAISTQGEYPGGLPASDNFGPLQGSPAYGAPLVGEAERKAPAAGNSAASAVIAEQGVGASGTAQDVFAERLWLQPTSAQTCTVSIGSFSKSFVPSFSCGVYRRGVMERVFCPVYVDASETGQVGLVELRASGSCNDYGKFVVSSDGFRQVTG